MAKKISIKDVEKFEKVKIYLKSEINERLHSAPEVKFTFQKRDGSFRKSVGTLNNEFLTKRFGASQVDIKQKRKTPDDLIVYFDLEADSFRSFRVEQFIRFN